MKSVNNLAEISVKPKKGNELFYNNNHSLSFDILEFWSWNQSNLFENRTRGILAEFIVAKALDIELQARVEWDDFDLISNNGRKIEIKSAAYIQSWNQKKYSIIKFNIAESNRYKDKIERQSDYYIFCLFNVKDENLIDPMNLSQWIFYIVKTDTINARLKNQKTITLSSLLSLDPIVSVYGDIKNHIL